jgi:glucosylceramidase
MVLNEEGKSGWGWKQNSLMLIDRQSGEVTYTKDFAPLALLGRFVRPGDQLLKVETSKNIKSLAVRSKERLVVFLENNAETAANRTIEIAGKKVAVELPAQSLCAFEFKN